MLNVDPLRETLDLMSVILSYEARVTVLNVIMSLKGIELQIAIPKIFDAGKIAEQ